MAVTRKYRVRLREYLFFANRMKRAGQRVLLSSLGPFGLAVVVEDKAGGRHPFECMFLHDSQGKLPATTNAWALEWLLIGKAARDWHITEWAQGLVERVITMYELRESGVPESILKSVRKARFGSEAACATR
jgi:hypothetical protein